MSEQETQIYDDMSKTTVRSTEVEGSASSE